jgi:ribosomal protein L37AE/L43A
MTYDGDRCRTPACRTIPTPGYCPRGLCPFHEAEGLDAIGALHHDWVDLQPLVWDKLRAGLSEAGTSAFGPSEPINYDTAELAGRIAYTAVLWEIAVMDRIADDGLSMTGWPTGDDLARAVHTLYTHYSVLLAQRDPIPYEDYDEKPATGDGADAIVELTALHRKARGMIGITTKTTAEPGPCPNCKRETLRHRAGSDEVQCATCRATMTWDDYQDAVSIVPVRRAA